MLGFLTRAPAENPAGLLRLSIKGAPPRQPVSRIGLGPFAANIDGTGKCELGSSSVARNPLPNLGRKTFI